MKAGTDFFQTPINVGIFTSQMSLMASRIVNPFQKVFNRHYPVPAEETLFLAATVL